MYNQIKRHLVFRRVQSFANEFFAELHTLIVHVLLRSQVRIVEFARLITLLGFFFKLGRGHQFTCEPSIAFRLEILVEVLGMVEIELLVELL